MVSQSGEDKIRVLRVVARLNVGGPSIHVVNFSGGRFDQILVVGKESRDEDVGLRACAQCVGRIESARLSFLSIFHRDITALKRLWTLMRCIGHLSSYCAIALYSLVDLTAEYRFSLSLD
jgi:hypothetical protein